MNPYINLKSYTEANSKYFKGRDNEIEDVLAILKRSDVVVIYSESAEGKSSLLGAGLAPRFRRMGYIPVNIVFTEEEFRNPHPDFNKIIISRINDALRRFNDEIINNGGNVAEHDKPTALDSLLPPSFSRRLNESELYEWVSTNELEIPDDNDVAKQLTSDAWWLLRNFAVERYAARFNFILVFDQFEEVFSQPDLEWTNSLFEWLERLYSDKCPDAVSESLLKLYVEEELVPQFNINRSFKEIFSMRNEYIGDLDYWGCQKHFMPELRSSRYCLKPLTISEASEVIELGFKNRPEVKAQILSALTGIDVDSLSSADADIARVQAMLLSIICSALSTSDIDSDYLKALKVGDKDVLQRIVYDVYRSQMNECKVSATHRKKIEQALIDGNGKRVRIKSTTPLLEGIDFDSKYKKALKRQGIIRSSKINGEEYIELVHDQLANAISRQEIKSKKLRRSIASVFLVILTCLLVLGLWIKNGMSIDSTTIKNDELYKYSLALIDEDIKDVLTMSGTQSLENNSIVESYRLDSCGSTYINIHNNEKLKTLIIMPHKQDGYPVSIDIRGNLLLQKVVIADSVSDLDIDISDNIGFCQIEIGRGTKNIKIRPRDSYTQINSLDGTYKCVNGRWWNFIDSTLLYIPEKLKYEYFFSFPFSINSIDYYYYNNYFNIPQSGPILDLSERTQIKRIENHEFERCHYDSVILPEKLENIKYDAFANFKNLKHIVIPASVREISKDAFDDDCEVIFKRNFSADEIEIYYNTTISGLKLPQRRSTLDLGKLAQIKEISRGAFEHSRFDTIILPKNLSAINGNAFANCKNLKHIVLPKTLNTIGSDAFSDCKNLRQIVIPASVREIPISAFDDDCDVIFKRDFSAEEIEIYNDTTISGLKIPQRRGTLDLSKLTQIKEIGGNAFYHSRYDTIYLPENLEYINYNAFAGCKNLKQIVIPASVKRIHDSAFDDDCDVIFKRDFSAEEIEIYNDTTISGLKIHQRRGSLDLSNLTQIKKIDWGAFAGSRYDTIILPKNLNTIGPGAFADCKNLKHIVIPASIKEIHFSAIPSNCETSFNGSPNDKVTNGLCINNTVILWQHGIIDLRDIEIYYGLDLTSIPSRNSNIILPSGINSFRCSDIERVYIEDKALKDLINQKKYIQTKDIIVKRPVTNSYYFYHYKGTYFRPDSLIVANDINCPEDIYFIGRLPLRRTCNDSSLIFNDNSNLDKIKAIHLSLPRPRIWTYQNDTTLKSSIFNIDIPDSIKRQITLYVPHGSKKFYEETLSFKAFKEIREDKWINRYEDEIFVRFIGCYYWFSEPVNLLIVIIGILLVVAFFYKSFKISYKKRHPYSSNVRTNILSLFNGVIMAIVAIMGFMAVYWWMWDLSRSNYLISVLGGIIGAVIVLGICYFKILPTIWNLIYGKSVSIFRKFTRLFY